MSIFDLNCFGRANPAAFSAAYAAFAYRKIVSIKNLVKIDTGIETCGTLGLSIVHDALLALAPFFIHCIARLSGKIMQSETAYMSQIHI